VKQTESKKKATDDVKTWPAGHAEPTRGSSKIAWTVGIHSKKRVPSIGKFPPKPIPNGDKQREAVSK